MSAISDEHARAKAAAAAARTRLTGTLVDLQARLRPRALARDMIDELRDAGSAMARGVAEAARRHPGPLIGIGATIVALFASDWMAQAFADPEARTSSGDPQDQNAVTLPTEGKSDDH